MEENDSIRIEEQGDITTDEVSTPANETEISETPQHDNGEYSELSNRIAKMEEMINRMSGVVNAIHKAQTNVVDMGATIYEGAKEESDDEGFIPIEKLDFTI